MDQYDRGMSMIAGGATANVAVAALAKAGGKAQQSAADQTMVNNLVAARAAMGEGETGNATFAQSRNPVTGRLSPVRESEAGAGPEGHAEPQVIGQGSQVAVDQIPCSACTPKVAGMRVVVPENPAKPGGSPKSAARDAASGKIDGVVPRVVQEGPGQPSYRGTGSQSVREEDKK